MTSLRVLRGTLILVLLFCFSMSGLFFFSPQTVGSYFGFIPDSFHSYAFLSIGAMLLVFGIGAVIAVIAPTRGGDIIALLIFAHFLLFLVDVVVTARGTVALRLLLPEMAYYIIVCVLLIRSFPTQESVLAAVTEGPDIREKEVTQSSPVVEPDVPTKTET